MPKLIRKTFTDENRARTEPYYRSTYDLLRDNNYLYEAPSPQPKAVGLGGHHKLPSMEDLYALPWLRDLLVPDSETLPFLADPEPPMAPEMYANHLLDDGLDHRYNWLMNLIRDSRNVRAKMPYYNNSSEAQQLCEKLRAMKRAVNDDLTEWIFGEGDPEKVRKGQSAMQAYAECIREAQDLLKQSI